VLVLRQRRRRAYGAQHLLENTELPTACRCRVRIVIDHPAAFHSVLFHSGDGVALEAYDHDMAVGDVWGVERHALLNGADVVPAVLLQNLGCRRRTEALLHSLTCVDADLGILGRIVAILEKAAVGRDRRTSGASSKRQRGDWEKKKSPVHPAPSFDWNSA